VRNRLFPEGSRYEVYYGGIVKLAKAKMFERSWYGRLPSIGRLVELVLVVRDGQVVSAEAVYEGVYMEAIDQGGENGRDV
jgi:hypothetical protein